MWCWVSVCAPNYFLQLLHKINLWLLLYLFNKTSQIFSIGSPTLLICDFWFCFFLLFILRHHNNGNFNDEVAHTCDAECVCSELICVAHIFFTHKFWCVCCWKKTKQSCVKLGEPTLFFVWFLFLIFCSYYGTTTTGILMHTKHSCGA